MLFFIWATVLLIADNGADFIYKIREYASVYYSLFFIFVVMLLSSLKSSDSIFKTLIVAAVFATIYVFIRFLSGMGNITTTDLVYRYGNYELVGILILFCFYFAKFIQGDGKGYISLIVIVVCVFVVNFLIAHRSGSLAMSISTLIVLFFLGRNKRTIDKAVLSIVLGVISLTLIMFALPEIGGRAISRIAGVFDSSIYEDPNASWRLLVWKHVVSNMSIMEILHGVGWGYKVPLLVFSGRDYSVDGFIGIHNSIIYYFLHTGLIGITFLLTFLFSIYLKAITAINNLTSTKNKRIMVTLFASNLGILFFALFNVVLEGPYMSIVFWVTLGLLYNYSKHFAK